MPVADSAWSETDPLVQWLRRELLPPLVEAFQPTRLVAFRLPSSVATASERPPGLLIVSRRFESVPVPERNDLVRRLLDSVLPVRPMCLTPGEYEVSAAVPGPVIEAMANGYRLDDAD